MTAAPQTYTLRFPDGFTIKDARGFNVAGGTLGRSLPFPLPPTTAGAARTAIGAGAGWLSDPASAPWASLLDSVELAGPLAITRDLGASPDTWEPLFPRPQDALGFADRVVWLKPRKPSTRARACWSDDDTARATDALWRPELDSPDKPLGLPDWWAQEDAMAWLGAPDAFNDALYGGLVERSPKLETRLDMRLAIDPETRTARAGHLFGIETRETLATPHLGARELGVRLGITRATNANLPAPGPVWRFGGEGRVAEVKAVPIDPWAWPAKAYEGWAPSTCFRLLVVTPCAFATGWLPDFLEAASDRFTGNLPLVDGSSLPVTLRAAAIDRPVPVSGWDFTAKSGGAPKASHLLVPAGSVYYFESDRTLDPKDLSNLWLTSLQSAGQPRRDGFGLVVPGAWPQ